MALEPAAAGVAGTGDPGSSHALPAVAPNQKRALGMLPALGLTFLVQAIVTLLAAAVPVLAPMLAEQHGWSLALLGLYPSLVYAGTFAGSLAAAALLRRHGAFAVSLGCVAVGSVGLLGMLPGSLALAALAAFGIGAANGPVVAASSQLLGRLSGPRSVALVIGAKQTAVPTGALLAGVAVPPLAIGLGWDAAVCALSIAAILYVLLALPAVPHLDREKAAPGSRGILQPLRDLLALPDMCGIVAASMIFAVLQLMLRTFLVAYAVAELGFDLITAGLIFAASQAAGVAGQIGWAAIADRMLGGRATLLLVGLVIAVSALLLALLPAGWPLAAAFAVSVLFGAAVAGYRPVVLAEIVRRAPPGTSGVLTAGQTTSSTAAIMLGVPLFGALVAAAGYRFAFAAAALFALAGVLALARPVRTTRDARPGPGC
jgi:predicted MFS family arabinose efflux permease